MSKRRSPARKRPVLFVDETTGRAVRPEVSPIDVQRELEILDRSMGSVAGRAVSWEPGPGPLAASQVPPATPAPTPSPPVPGPAAGPGESTQQLQRVRVRRRGRLFARRSRRSLSRVFPGETAGEVTSGAFGVRVIARVVGVARSDGPKRRLRLRSKLGFVALGIGVLLLVGSLETPVVGGHDVLVTSTAAKLHAAAVAATTDAMNASSAIHDISMNVGNVVGLEQVDARLAGIATTTQAEESSGYYVAQFAAVNEECAAAERLVGYLEAGARSGGVNPTPTASAVVALKQAELVVTKAFGGTP